MDPLALFTFPNPVLYGAVLLGVAFGLFGLAAWREGARRQVGRDRRSRLVLPAGALAAVGVVWPAWYLLAVPAFDSQELIPREPLGDKLTFVAALYKGGQRCPRLTSRFCNYALHEALPDTKAECLADLGNIRGSWAHQIANPTSFSHDKKNLMILRGDIVPRPMRGTCRLKVSHATRKLRAKGLALEGEFRCNPDTVCR